MATSLQQPDLQQPDLQQPDLQQPDLQQPDVPTEKPAPPMLWGWPLIGNLFQFMRNRPALFRRGLEQVGPVFGIRLANRPAAVLVGPEYQELFFKETDKRLSMDKTYRFLKAALGEVAFVASPETYIQQRPVMLQPFKASKMASYLRVMESEVQNWLDSLGDEGEFELVEAMNTLVQNVAAHALMGREFREQLGAEFWALYGVIGKSLDPALPPHLPLPKFIRRDRAKARLQAMLRPIIADRRAHPAAHDDFLQDFVTTPLADGTPASDEVVISMIMGLMFAGHETTVGQAAWTIIQLLQHPAYRADMQRELNATLPPGQPCDARALRKLEHISWAVQETARMHPSADLLLRLAEEDVDVGQYRIPQGWMVIVAAGLAHFLPTIFTDPMRYDPLRFAPDRAEDQQHRFALIGFGGGTHKCTGMNFATNEMSVITALLFQQFELELRTPDPQTDYGAGAARPSSTIIRYRRRPGRAAPNNAVTSTAVAGAAGAGCPHMNQSS